MNRVFFGSLAALATMALFVGSASRAAADEWPQWMGPGRDNIWRETGLLDKFPKGGPKIVWRKPIAGGYSGPAVVGERVYISDFDTKDDVKVDNFGRKSNDGKERVFCLNEATGEVVWKHEYPVTYSISYPAGPRCTPTVHAGKVYTLGAEGHLFCFNAATGDVLWFKDFKKEYKTKSALWGYASHPLVDGENLICVVGGSGTQMCAFNLETGVEKWRAMTSPEQGYSPPTIIEAAGVRQLIALRPDAVTALDPATGTVLWTTPYDATNGSIVMAPIKSDDYLFIGGYSNKNLLLKLKSDKPGVEIVWRNKGRHGVAPVNVQPFLHEKMIIGYDQGGKMFGVELPSGKRVWENTQIIGKRPQGSETAFIVKQGDRFWFFNELGELVIGKLTAKGYEEIDRAKIIEPTNFAFGREVVWCMPAFAHRKLFVRNDKEIICVDLAKN